MQGDLQGEALEGPLLTQAGGASELASLTQQPSGFSPATKNVTPLTVLQETEHPLTHPVYTQAANSRSPVPRPGTAQLPTSEEAKECL